MMRPTPHQPDEQQHPLLPIPIVCEDPILHTEKHPLCNDPDCPCWQTYYERQDKAEAAYIERGFMSYEQLPEFRTFEPEMTVLEYSRLVGYTLLSSEEHMPRVRYRHSLYFATMSEAETTFEVLDEALFEILDEMSVVPDSDDCQAELRFYTHVELSERDRVALLHLAGKLIGSLFNQQDAPFWRDV